MSSLRIDGADLSHWQSGTLNWGSAKKAGLKFVYHKATESTTYKDPLYGKRRAEAKAAGVAFGAYHFARPTKTNAKAEAQWFLAAAKPAKGDLRPALDLEVNKSGLSQADLTKWVSVFVSVVKAATGAVPVLYTPFDLDDTFGCILWRPRYNKDNMVAGKFAPPALPWDIWQFSNGVLGSPNSLAGFGNCDLNHFRDGLSVKDLLIPVAEKKPVAPATPKPAGVTAQQIVTLAKTQVGVQEGGRPGAYNNDQKFSDEVPGFKWSDGQPWCATFVNWVFWKAGAWDLIPKAGHSASCDIMGKSFKDAKQWGVTPKVGAVVFYGTPTDLSHVGIVVEVGPDYIVACEGNTNDEGSREGHEVALRKRTRNAYIIGYGYPNYASRPVSRPVEVTPPKSRPWRMFHLADYAKSDSFEGLREAKREGRVPDINLQIDADGVGWITHWARPLRHGWSDPQKKIKSGTPIQLMTTAEVSRLVNGGRKMHTVAATLAEAERIGLTKVELDVKYNPQVLTPKGEALFARTKANARKHKVSVVVKTCAGYRNDAWAFAVLSEARRLRFHTMLMVRGESLSRRKWWPVIDYVSGKVRWTA